MVFIAHSAEAVGTGSYKNNIPKQPQHRRRQAPKFNFASEIYALLWVAILRLEMFRAIVADLPPTCTVARFGAVALPTPVQKRILHRFCIRGFAIVFESFFGGWLQKRKTASAV